MKIGIVGKMCSGKTTLANQINNYYDNKYFITSFAKKIKVIAVEIFNMKGKNRKLLQDIGTKMREIDKDVWAKYALNEADNHNFAIIDDVRFENEIKILKDNGWLLIKINISDDLQLQRLKITYPETWKEHFENIKHESEKSNNIDEIYYDLIIDSSNSPENNLNIVIDYIGKQ